MKPRPKWTAPILGAAAPAGPKREGFVSGPTGWPSAAAYKAAVRTAPMLGAAGLPIQLTGQVPAHAEELRCCGQDGRSPAPSSDRVCCEERLQLNGNRSRATQPGRSF